MIIITRCPQKAPRKSSSLLTLLFIVVLGATSLRAGAQNVGIGTLTPTKMLSVAGSIAVDHDNANLGTLDSAALVFGTDGYPAGISSNKANGAGQSYRGLDFWTTGQRRLSIMDHGSVGIGTTNPQAKLHVVGALRAGPITALGPLSVTGLADVAERVNINGSAFNGNYRLTVNGGSAYVGGNATVTGTVNAGVNLLAGGFVAADGHVSGHGLRSYTDLKADVRAAIGGAVDDNYRLRVWDGNSRFGGDVQVTGNLNAGEITTNTINGTGDVQVTGNLNAGEITTNTINGTGVVRSAGSSSLRMGFNSVWINATIGSLDEIDYTASITDFEGGANDVRVFVSQFVTDPLPQYVNWNHFGFHIHSVDPVANTCKVRVVNNTTVQLSIKGTLYLTSVAKD